MSDWLRLILCFLAGFGAAYGVRLLISYSFRKPVKNYDDIMKRYGPAIERTIKQEKYGE